ncbi:MAG: 50S ribosomal protein L11 methyltransferase [Pseudomonadota bacterium]
MTQGPNKAMFSDPAHFVAHGLKVIESDFPHLALPLAQKALDAHPSDPMWQKLVDLILCHRLPTWHAGMLRDQRRNEAYSRAIEQTAKGRVVLDIGTGSGLLAMIAARAGAAHVFACEADQRLAAAARQVIETNGLSDRITVYARHSNALSRTDDLAGGVDMVVSEIFSEDLIREGVLPSLAHARSELCQADALFLPEKASVEMALAEFPIPAPPPDEVEGFDLRPIHKLFVKKAHASPAAKAVTIRGASRTLIEFDFTPACELPMNGSSTVALASDGGELSGAAQWIKIQFTPDVVYENAPGGEANMHWLIGLIPFGESVSSEAGDTFGFEGWHNEHLLTIWPTSPA